VTFAAAHQVAAVHLFAANLKVKHALSRTRRSVSRKSGRHAESPSSGALRAVDRRTLAPMMAITRLHGSAAIARIRLRAISLDLRQGP
jgi:hypothetical protein